MVSYILTSLQFDACMDAHPTKQNKYKNTNDDIQAVISIVYRYMQESLDYTNESDAPSDPDQTILL